MAEPLSVRGSRLFSPAEVEAIRRVISKPSNRRIFDVLLYSGMRLSELQQLGMNRRVFDEDRQTITIQSGKVLASQNERRIRLGDRGIAAVLAYLEEPRIPKPGTWRSNLLGWARSARLPPLPRETAAGNPAAVTVRSTRKTWESWLMLTYPDRILDIVLSQGHSETIAIRHYVNLSWMPTEREAIRAEVVGW